MTASATHTSRAHSNDMTYQLVAFQVKYQRCVRFSEDAAVFGSHGCDSGVRIWVDIFPETFGHPVTLHLEGPEVIVLPIKLLDD
jgi:hypothetical protein